MPVTHSPEAQPPWPTRDLMRSSDGEPIRTPLLESGPIGPRSGSGIGTQSQLQLGPNAEEEAGSLSGEFEHVDDRLVEFLARGLVPIEGRLDLLLLVPLPLERRDTVPGVDSHAHRR